MQETVFPEDKEPLQQPAALSTSALHVGKYTLLGELGRGAMGVVYRAWDPELARAVALKMLLWGGLAREEDRLRFLHEARAIARLNHPGIVRVLDSGVHEGCPYFTMDLITGTTLRSRLERDGSLPPQEAAALMAQVSQALHHAHQRGIIHRDLKPANILLGEDGRALISDFGIARLSQDEAHQLTATGQILGTPAYMSPEQALGLSSATGPGSDVYGLGAVLYHLITGRPPFAHEPLQSLAQRANAAPPSLTGHLTRALSDLGLVCQKALAPRASDRYPTAQALAEDLERFTRGEPVLASAPELRRRLAWQIQRHRANLVAILITLLVALLGIGLWQGLVRWQAHRAHELREFLAQERLHRLDRELAPLWKNAQEATADSIMKSFLELPEIRDTRAPAQALLMFGHHLLEAGDVEKALAQFARAYLVAEWAEDQQEALLSLATVMRMTGDLKRLDTLDARLLQPQVPEADKREPEHSQAMAQLWRQLDRQTQHLRARGEPRLASLLETLSHYTVSRQNIEDYGLSDRTRGLVRYQAINGTTSVYIPAPLAYPPGTPRDITGEDEAGLIRIDSPNHRSFVQPLLDLGAWQDARLVTASFYNDKKVPEAGLYAIRQGKLEPVASLPLDYFLGAAYGDLDGDGHIDYFVGKDRRLFSFQLRDDRTVTMTEPDAATNMSNSQVQSMFVADLDGDGVQELVVGMGPWRAYDVRIYHAGPRPNTLTLVARRKLGFPADVAPFPLPNGQTAILVDQQSSNPNRRVFPESHPAGMPVGTYVLSYRTDRLEIEHFIPPPFINAIMGRMLVGDFNGDQQNDVAIQVAVPALLNAGDSAQDSHFLQLITREVDGRWSATVLAGIGPLQAFNLDDDPAPELIVDEPSSRRLLVLGKGTNTLPPLARQERPEHLTFPSTPWERIDALISLGMGESSIQQLLLLATSSDSPTDAANALIKAGELLEQQGDPLQAIEQYKKASEKQPKSSLPREKVAQVYRHLWRPQDEALELKGLLALRDLTPARRQEVEARLVSLEAVLRRPLVDLRLNQPLMSAWKVAAAEALQRDHTTQSLRIRTVGENYDLLVLPLDWDGGQLSLTLDMTPQLIEWASMVEIGLRKPNATPQTPHLSIRLHGRGGGTELIQCINASLIKNRWPIWEKKIAGPLQGLPMQVRLELSPAQNQILVQVNDLIRLKEREESPDFDRGPLELYVASVENPWPSRGLMALDIRNIQVRGATLSRDSVKPVGPLESARRLLVEGNLALAHSTAQSVQAPPGTAQADEKEQVLLLSACRQGSKEECAARWQKVLTDSSLSEQELAPPTKPIESSLTPWRTLTLKYPNNTLWRRTLSFQLRDDPGLVMPMLSNRLGLYATELFSYFWDAREAHPDQLYTQFALTSGLGLLDTLEQPEQGPLPPALDTLELMAQRGSAFRRMGQPLLARQQLEHARAFAQRILPRVRGVAEIANLAASRARVAVETALTYLATGHLEAAIDHFRDALLLSPHPELLSDEVAALTEVAPFLNEPRMKALIHPPDLTLPASEDTRGTR